MTWNTVETQVFSNLSADSPTFTVRGGQYAMTITATWGGGSATLKRRAADNSTYVTCLTAFSADGYATVNLPSGIYKLVIATATGVYGDLTSVATVM